MIDARCGTLRVLEDRSLAAPNAADRKIDLHIMVLPARGRDPAPDPLFILAGGPGQAATEVGPMMLAQLRDVHLKRDIVLVDQRGTGRSNPLDCEVSDDGSLAALFRTELVMDELLDCLASLDADPSLYTTPAAMDDLDDVREALGYEQINLYGASYGTRAALVYMRRHPDRVRTAVLDGAAPVEIRLPLHMAEDGAAALETLFLDCERDESCHASFPDLRAHHSTLLERLADQPQPAVLEHPRTGVVEEVVVSEQAVVAILRGALYSSELAALVPLAIERAHAGDFQQLAAMAVTASATGDSLSQGMFLSVVCAEDIPFITDEELSRHLASEDPKSGALESLREACVKWPVGEIPDGYADPVRSTVPTLILSGANDPATPSRWGDAVAATLPASRHLVIPGIGHGAWAHGCVGERMAEFMAQGSASELDFGCTKRIHRPAFFLSSAGPVALEARTDGRRPPAKGRESSPEPVAPTEGEAAR
jgi:pimeloyl-ACP methyl ester carboxylesterase